MGRTVYIMMSFSTMYSYWRSASTTKYSAYRTFAFPSACFLVCTKPEHGLERSVTSMLPRTFFWTFTYPSTLSFFYGWIFCISSQHLLPSTLLLNICLLFYLVYILWLNLLHFLSASAAKYCAFEHLLTILLIIYFTGELLYFLSSSQHLFPSTFSPIKVAFSSIWYLFYG